MGKKIIKIYKIILKPVVPGLIKNKTETPAKTTQNFSKNEKLFIYSNQNGQNRFKAVFIYL